MSPLEVALIRIVGPAVILIAARFFGRAVSVTTVLLVGALSIAPSPFMVEERHGRGTQALLVLACALLGVSMRMAEGVIRGRHRHRGRTSATLHQ